MSKRVDHRFFLGGCCWGRGGRRGARSRGDAPHHHRHSQGLRWRLRGAAVALVPRAVGQGSVHLLLEDVRQGMQGDAADGGRVVTQAVGVENAALGWESKKKVVSL